MKQTYILARIKGVLILRSDLGSDQKGYIFEIVRGGIDSSGQTIFCFSHIEGIIWGVGEQAD